MNRAFLKHFFSILIILFICSGCKQNSIIGENFFAEQPDPVVIKYKSGAILLKSNKLYNVTNQKSFVNSESSVREIQFGPGNINFEN